jgi:hypothetical protein
MSEEAKKIMLGNSSLSIYEKNYYCCTDHSRLSKIKNKKKFEDL